MRKKQPMKHAESQISLIDVSTTCHIQTNYSRQIVLFNAILWQNVKYLIMAISLSSAIMLSKWPVMWVYDAIKSKSYCYTKE